MSDSTVLARYSDRDSEEPSALEPRLVTDAGEDFVSFGWVRGTRDRALMIELRKKDGNILAVGYGWLEKAAFDPSEGITLHLAGQKIRIKGRNLNAEARTNVRLFEGITRHRVPWIQEADEPTSFEAGEHDTVVDSIEW